jgi:hypothetical protein
MRLMWMSVFKCDSEPLQNILVSPKNYLSDRARVVITLWTGKCAVWIPARTMAITTEFLSSHFTWQMPRVVPGLDPRAILRLKVLGQLKKFNDLVGNRTRDLPACSMVPQPTTLPRAPFLFILSIYYSPVILSFDVIRFELLIALLNKSQINNFGLWALCTLLSINRT